MNVYKFRAECMADLERLSEILPAQYLIMPVKARTKLPDIVVHINTEFSICQVRAAMLMLIDGHVMAETLNYKDRYTGERMSTEEWIDSVQMKPRWLQR